VLGVVLESVELLSVEREVSVDVELLVGLLALVESARPAVLLVDAVGLVDKVGSADVELRPVELGEVLGLDVSVAAVLLSEVGKVELLVAAEELLGLVELVLPYVEPVWPEVELGL